MRALPLDIGPLHFVGIGGIGMSGIAEVLHNLGYKIQGSDMAENANVQRLRSLGIPIAVGHEAENLGDAQVLVISSAIKDDNPELREARDRFLPVVRRAEMLGELMRLKWSIAVAGTHGKTTTTSLVAELLEHAGLAPTVINGGILNARGTNAYLGTGDWMVVEADESDGTFTRLPATIAIVTNIDPEHLDFYGSFEQVREAFRTFVHNLPFYGFACMCIDHPEVQAMIPQLQDRRIVTYGMSPQADIRGVNLTLGSRGATFDVVVTDRPTGSQRTIPHIQVPMYGRHNVLNALGAIGVAVEMGIDGEVIRHGLARFKGVRRRFTRVGEAGGITIIDDYGHHPVEIEAVLSAARDATERAVIAVVQPHRYSRLNTLFEDFCTCFNDADAVVISDVYAAGETPIPGASKEALAEGLKVHGHKSVHLLEDPADLGPLLAGIAHRGDLVICLGAGTITTWAQALPDALSRAQRGVRPSITRGGEAE